MISMETILALDQGTTSSRALLFDRSGKVLALAQRELPQIFPRPGWVEHDAARIWRDQIELAAEALGQRPEAGVAAIGITNQRETSVIWDRATGEPIHNAIVWQDRRTAAECERLRQEGHEQLVRERTGLMLDPYFSGTKIAWMLDHLPGARERAARGELAFGTIDSWLLWNLTGGEVHATDATNASRTLLYDIHLQKWDGELAALLGIPSSLLPAVRSSSGIFGHTAAGLPIPAGIPIAGIAGDQQAALFGQRCTRPGMAKNTYGTGSFLVLNTGGQAVFSRHGLLATIGVARPDTPVQFALEGSIFVTGAAVQWLRDGLGIIGSAAEVEALAATVPDSGGVSFVPAFTGLGAPLWDPHARGAILGLSRGTTAAHIARATLEAIALQTSDVLEAMRSDSGMEIRELRVDGGASSNDLLMQIQADLAGIPVVRTRLAETTAIGSAYLAGLAIGFNASEEELDRQWEADRIFEPALSAARRAALRERWSMAVERSRAWAGTDEQPLP
jgi:glycerol kinase